MIQRDPKTGLILVDDHFRVHLETQAQPQPEDAKHPENETTQQLHSSEHASQATPAEALMNDVFALGDTTIMKSGRLPGTAQVANQQALWLAKTLNKHPTPSSFTGTRGFGFKDLGVMTYLGGSKAILQPPHGKSNGNGNGKATKGIKGWVAYLIWRGAYLTMTLSWRNKFLVPVQWLAVKVFGRDVSRF